MMPTFFASMAVFVVFGPVAHILLARMVSSNEPPGETAIPVLDEGTQGEREGAYVYREEPARGGRTDSLLAGVVAGAAVAAIPIASIVEGSHDGFTRGDALRSALWVGIALAVVCLLYKRHYDVACREVRLDADGTCEFETRRRLIRLHVNEIQSVKYRCGDESDWESYTVRFPTGKIELNDRMSNVLEFLARLERMNPAVQFRASTTCRPAETAAMSRSNRSPPRRTSATTERWSRPRRNRPG
jgi:hypothetical protein